MKRIVSCPYCDTQQGVILISTKERIDIEHKCINPKCEREYLIPINYKKVFLSRTFSVSDAKYKFTHHVKTYHSGIVIPIDLLKLRKPPPLGVVRKIGSTDRSDIPLLGTN